MANLSSKVARRRKIKKDKRRALANLNRNRDVVFLILDKLGANDLVIFAAVCKEWRAFSKEYIETTKRWSKEDFPMRLTLQKKKPVLYSVFTGKVYDNIDLSGPYNDKFILGSSHGWLARADSIPAGHLAVDIQLWNPFRKAASPIRLPTLQLYDLYRCGLRHTLKKVILSDYPSSNPDNCLVIALTSVGLYFLRGGQKEWSTFIRFENDREFMEDAIHYRSRIYITGSRGSLWSLDVCSSSYELVFKHPWYVDDLKPSYVVESATEGGLLLVQRIDGPTLGFLIHKFAFDDNGSLVQQAEVKNIGAQALFLGGGHSFSVLALNYMGCRPNCIYYTYEDNECRLPVILDLHDRTTTKLKPMIRVLWMNPRCDGLPGC